MNKKRLTLYAFIVVVVVLIGIMLGLVGFITDYLWFRELGYTSVFLKKLFTQLQIGVPLFLIVVVLGYLYLKVIKRGYLKRVNISESVKSSVINWITIGMSAIAAGIVTYMTVSSMWLESLRFANSTDFSIADPIYNLDISFYIFKLQFITQLNQIILTLIIIIAIMTVLYYLVLLSLYKPKPFETVKPGLDDETEAEEDNAGGAFGAYGDLFQKLADAFAKQMGMGTAPKQKTQQKSLFSNNNVKELLQIASNQIVVLGVIFFLMLGVSFFLRQYDLLYSRTGVLFGAGYTDVSITLWMYRALIVLSLVGAVFFTLGMKKKNYKMVLSVPVVMILVGIMGAGTAQVVQNLVVSPDEINKETQYLRHSITYTQNAYGLENVEARPFEADESLSSQDLLNNSDTIANIRINDYGPAKQFYNNAQTIRNYYLFNNVYVDRYMINGEYTQTFMSAREVGGGLINQEWINRYLKYTHGYGIVQSRVDKVTATGQPDLLIQDIPPKSSVQEIEITRPEIYFGELTNDYVLVHTDELEFDYPVGDDNAFTTYEGTAGIPLNLFNRTLFSIREQSLKLMVSTNINRDSKIVINRNITERVRKIMPYISYDDNPYIVTVGGKLYWIIDAYTTSSYYPYSEPFSLYSNWNYIRNSIKVVVDAYNGSVDYYLVDDKDPVANTLMKIFPVLFKPRSEMPEEISKHIRYPAYMLNVQAKVYERFHVDNVNVFYQGEDVWEIGQEMLGAEGAEPMSSQYYMIKLPGENQAEFINSIPYTPRTKKNLTGLLVARNDGAHYGQLILYQMPKNKRINGPELVEALIDQNDEIAKEFSLWKNSGSTYIRGNLFIIPIEQALLYVEPVYLVAATSSIPEVRRVIVIFGDKIAYTPTLAGSLDVMFGIGSTSTGSSTGAGGQELSQNDLIERANDALVRAEAAQQQGDWAAYGRELNLLKQYLGELYTRAGFAPTPEVLDENGINQDEAD